MQRQLSLQGRLLLGILSVLIVGLAWWALTATVVPRIRFPSPASVWEALTENFGGLLAASGITWLRVMAGFVLGAAFGFLNGLALSRNRIMLAMNDPIIEILRPLPPIAAIPFFILWFGLGELGKVLLVAFGCSVILLIATLDAVRHVPVAYVEAASTLGAGTGDIYRTVVTPAILPTVLASLRIALGISFSLGIAAEFMGASEGLGYRIMLAGRILDTAGMVVGILLVGILSLVTDYLIRVMSARLAAWTVVE